MGKARVVVAMSGGVDSSMAAALLQEAGYEVIGVMMRLWSQPGLDSAWSRPSCCSVEAVDEARAVSYVLGIPFYFLNFEREFQRYVVDYFCQEYARGRTPNPCLACNQHLKFRFLLGRALALGADYLATGHYARIERRGGECRLLKAVDPAKDQSYVLYTLGQEVLKHLLLPVGDYTKAEVRRLAAERRLPVAHREDSQELCFVPEGDYRRFLQQRLPPRPGDIVDAGGRVLGRHQGIAFYTVGQRRGLGVASRWPLYVAEIDAAHNRLVVGSGGELLQDRLFAAGVNWVSGRPSQGPLAVSAKIRYKSPEAPALLLPRGDGVEVKFERPQRAITPGQAVAFYQGEMVLGGGIIEKDGLGPEQAPGGWGRGELEKGRLEEEVGEHARSA